jgi:hypothetical protein
VLTGTTIDAVALNSGLVDIKRREHGTFSSSRFKVKLVKTIQPKTIQRSCFGFEFGANVPDSRTYLDDIRVL